MITKLKSIVKKVLKRVPPFKQVAQKLQLLREQNDQLSVQLREAQAEVEYLSGREGYMERLKRSVEKVEHYQPIYGVSGVINIAARDSKDRGELIVNELDGVDGLNILDVGSSLGYMSFYLADRGAFVEGWEMAAENVQVSNYAKDINGITNVNFRTTFFDQDTIKQIRPGQFDVALIFNVLHHSLRFHSLEYVQEMMRLLTDRVPILYLELARKGEDESLVWDKFQPKNELDIFKGLDVTIEKVAEFGNHLSDKKRPVYRVSKGAVKVAGQVFPVEEVSLSAYKDSPATKIRNLVRRYYSGKDVFIKEYGFSGDKVHNRPQIVQEIAFYIDHVNIPHIPRLKTFEFTKQKATLVLTKVKGALPLEYKGKLPVNSLVDQTLETFCALEASGLHHNDIRSWNVITDGKNWSVIDFGRTSKRAEEDNMTAYLWMLSAIANGKQETSTDHKKRLPGRDNFKDNPKMLAVYNYVKAAKKPTFSGAQTAVAKLNAA